MYSKALRQSYQHFPSLDQIIFEDGVCYKMQEAVLLAKVKNPSDLRAIHEIKKAFAGKILRPDEGVGEISDFERPVVTPVDWLSVPQVVTGKKQKKEPVIDSEVLTLEL